jgi:hypothetical protein
MENLDFLTDSDEHIIEAEICDVSLGEGINTVGLSLTVMTVSPTGPAAVEIILTEEQLEEVLERIKEYKGE